MDLDHIHFIFKKTIIPESRTINIKIIFKVVPSTNVKYYPLKPFILKTFTVYSKLLFLRNYCEDFLNFVAIIK